MVLRMLKTFPESDFLDFLSYVVLELCPILLLLCLMCSHKTDTTPPALQFSRLPPFRHWVRNVLSLLPLEKLNYSRGNHRRTFRTIWSPFIEHVDLSLEQYGVPKSHISSLHFTEGFFLKSEHFFPLPPSTLANMKCHPQTV